MVRNALHVRPATEDDLPAMVALAEELREALLTSPEGSARPGTAGVRVALEQRYRDALTCPDRHLVLAVTEDDEPLGMALLTVSPANALLDGRAVHMSHAVVADRHRRCGAGKALVAAAASYAEEHGLDQLVVSVRPGSREANRFFARLGFAPLAVRRAAPVTAVRRRLAQSERGTVDALVRRRPRRAVPVPVAAGGQGLPEDLEG